jgi:hypothetical protein
MGVLLLARGAFEEDFALVHGVVVGPAQLHHNGASNQGTALPSSPVRSKRQSGPTQAKIECSVEYSIL